MASSSISSPARLPCLKPAPTSTWKFINSNVQRLRFNVVVNCESQKSSSSLSSETGSPEKPTKLEIGSPVIVTEAPKIIKTAASMPCLKVNTGLVNPGDVGRAVSRKPKDVWAVRLSIGTHLMDGKYFKPLVVDE